MYGSQPVVLFPGANAAINNSPELQTRTNLVAGAWVTASNGIPFTGLEITNTPGPVFFRLH
jgi:hypothetical protein